MKSGNTIPFTTRPPSTESDVMRDEEGIFIEEEILGGVTIRTYNRDGIGVVHVFGDDKKVRFKKDPVGFDKALDGLNLEGLEDGKEEKIEGSGDNPDMIFKKKNGEIEIFLRRKQYKAIAKLRDVISRCSAAVVGG